MTQVQDSSDCCIYSKFSCTKKGYFKDEYLSLFAKKLRPRSPIINRGYYIRFKAIEEIFQHWLSLLNTSTFDKCQIISLGAGYDSSYLRLKSRNELPSGCHYVEIDFAGVLKKKLECVKKFLALQNLASSKNVPTDPQIVFHSDEYSMLGIDLTDKEGLESCFHSIGVQYDVPSLFLSECSITYIDPNKSDDLITWIQKNFPHSTFVTYEQVYPDDAFGLIMKSHFAHVGCPLKSITTYPTEKSQIQRFLKLNWSSISAITMYDLFKGLSANEKQRVKRLELFDEYEMWHEKCHHYVLVWASQGMLSTSPMAFMKTHFDHPAQRSFNWKSKSATEVVERFGHQVLSISSSLLLLCAGFGLSNKKHQKLGDIVLYNTETKRHRNLSTIDARMHHTLTKLSSNRVILLGGRSSPTKVFPDVLLIRCFSSDNSEVVNTFLSDEPDADSLESKSLLVSPSLCPQPMPIPTWRHSASLVDIKGVECIVTFGGCSVDDLVTNKCFILNTVTWKWSEVENQRCSPSSRHSHSAATYDRSCILISGGLSADETILNSVHMLSCQERKWSTLEVSGLFPRYSHTSHVWKNQFLYLVGGITSIASHKLGVASVNLDTLQAVEFSPPGQDPEYPILLSNHASYLCEEEIAIVGGGGNCFSFGTHFNKKIVFIDIQSFL